MKPLEIVLMVFFGSLTAAVTRFLCLFFMDAIAPVWIALTMLLLLALLTALLVWVRRMSTGARRRGFKQGLLAGLAPPLAVVFLAWRKGQLQDALLFLPISLIAVSMLLLAPLGLAWHLSSRIMLQEGARETDAAQHPAAAVPWLAVMVAVMQFFFCVGPWAQSLKWVDQARATRMKSRSRGIWAALLSASMEQEARGLPALWPRDLGFAGNESSTDYFRRLLADEAGEITEDAERRLVADLGYWSLVGPGLREATSARAFAAENNAWQVVCVDSNTPAWVPLLITRNADFGDWLTPTSQVRLIRSGPLNLRRVVWVMRGGGIYDAHFKTFNAGTLFPPEARVAGLAVTSMIYRIMRP